MDVVLHHRSDAADLSALVSQTERALGDFTCRVLPVFTPWHPSGGDISLPIRPLRSPPTISPGEVVKLRTYILSLKPESVPQSFNSDEILQNCGQTSLGRAVSPAQTCPEPGPPAAQPKDAILLEKEVKRPSSWSVFSQTQKGVLTVQNSQTFSREFHETIVSSHRLHMHQRAKWVIVGQNCTAGDLEPVWRGVNRAIRNSVLPTCNANIQRDLGQICVFCDVLYCEHIGKYLKEELQLTGKITLSVHRLGDILSL